MINDFTSINLYFEKNKEKWTSVHILVDSHTAVYCLKPVLTEIPYLQHAEIIEVDAGEGSKSLAICDGIWQTLLENQVDRNGLLVNLGGGVITDLGGWIASTYKRGIDCIHIPTTLLGMVDASIGGKTGINQAGIKNPIGTFYPALKTFVNPAFLSTLPRHEFVSGKAELLKHALIASPKLWGKVTQVSDIYAIKNEWIQEAIAIKSELVMQDFKESGLRKILNYGHTIGHAVEAVSFTLKDQKLTHGHAVAIGMQLVNKMAIAKDLLDEKTGLEINAYLSRHYPLPNWLKNKTDEIIAAVLLDKKNQSHQILMVMIKDIGKPVFNIQVSTEFIREIILNY